MKKMLKSFVATVLSLTLVVSGLGITKNVSAVTREDEWKANAVKTPAEGKLIGAGYIDVEFDNSMEGYTYSVYLDGQPVYWDGNSIVRSELGEKVSAVSKTKSFTSSDEGKTEVYTNTVSKHEITVEAKKDGQTITSEPRTFYVSKKGLALGGDMSDKITLSKLNCSWYYNWSTESFNNNVDANVAHIPMMWGIGDDNKENMENLKTTSNYILGFNEPDIEKQANIPMFFDAVSVWKQYISPLKLRKVSPAPAAPGGDSMWLKRFMNGDYICKTPKGEWGLYKDYEDDATKKWSEGIGEDVDAVVLHYYRNQINPQGLFDAVERLWNTYHKPIWITEMSLFGVKGTYTDFSYENEERRKQVEEYVTKLVEGLDKVPYVERYCWFPYDIDSTNDIDIYNGSGGTAMFEYATGLYTNLGRIYCNLGNPEGYNAETISDNEMYVYVPQTTPETTEKITETTNNPTSVSPTTGKNNQTTGKKINKPDKVKIISARNVKKKTVKLTWKKVSGKTKYQIQYSLNKKFRKGVKTKKTTKPNIKINRLSKKKKYYFRIRTINSAGIGKWSNVKKIVIRK